MYTSLHPGVFIMKEKEPVWRLDKVFKTYDMGEIKVEALRESSLDIPEGELLVILGLSGSGKEHPPQPPGCGPKASPGHCNLAGGGGSETGLRDKDSHRNIPQVRLSFATCRIDPLR